MQPSPFSPDVDIFSTPPTTPNMPLEDIRPSLSRRSSRPSNLRIQYSSAPNIVVDQHPSPMLARTHTDPNGDRAHASPPHSPMGIHQHAVPSPGQPQPSRSYVSPGPTTSPYFVHSQLQGASFKDYLHEKQCKAIDDARMEHNHHARAGPTHANGSVSEPEREDDSDYAGSLTRQLAETAVGVREMSKQLGQWCAVSRWAHAGAECSRSPGRSHTRALVHPQRPHRHQGARQSPHQAHPRARAVPHAQAARHRCVRRSCALCGFVLTRMQLRRRAAQKLAPVRCGRDRARASGAVRAVPAAAVLEQLLPGDEQ